MKALDELILRMNKFHTDSVSKVSGIDITVLNLISNGTIKNPKIEVLEKIGSALDKMEGR